MSRITCSTLTGVVLALLAAATATAGIDRSGLRRSQGTITRIETGLIVVNAVEYATGTSTVVVDGRSVTSSNALRLGEVVSITGTVDSGGATGTAQDIAFDDSVQGPITQIDTALGTMRVLGQLVRISGTTVFDDSTIQPPALATLLVGDIVEVSGFREAGGGIRASHVERKPAGRAHEVTGRVSNLDATLKHFKINALMVDYSSAALPDGVPVNGGCAEAKGLDYANGTLVATRVQPKLCGMESETGDGGEIEGLITAVRSPDDFDVAGQRVVTTANTFIQNGTAANIVLNRKVEVEGTFNAAGTLVATKVVLKLNSPLRFLGLIDGLNPGESTLSVFGVTIGSQPGTSYEDDSEANADPFDFGLLQVGDYVEVRGYAGSEPDTVMATLVRRDDARDREQLQGVAEDVLKPGFSVLGVSVVTSAGTEFRNIQDEPITANAFFLKAPNHLVKVRGTWSGGVFNANQAELED